MNNGQSAENGTVEGLVLNGTSISPPLFPRLREQKDLKNQRMTTAKQCFPDITGLLHT